MDCPEQDAVYHIHELEAEKRYDEGLAKLDIWIKTPCVPLYGISTVMDMFFIYVKRQGSRICAGAKKGLS